MQALQFTLASNGINFIKEYETGLLSSCHLKQLTHHPGSLQTFTFMSLYPVKWIRWYSSHWPLPHISAPARSLWLWWSRHQSGSLQHERTGFFLCQVAQTAAHLLEAQYPGWQTAQAGKWHAKTLGMQNASATVASVLTLTWRRGVSTTSLSFSICSLHPPTSL